MIKVTRFNGKAFYVNCDLIQFLEATPDTVIMITTGEKIVVSESVDEVIAAIKEFKNSIFYSEKQFKKVE